MKWLLVIIIGMLSIVLYELYEQRYDLAMLECQHTSLAGITRGGKLHRIPAENLAMGGTITHDGKGGYDFAGTFTGDEVKHFLELGLADGVKIGARQALEAMNILLEGGALKWEGESLRDALLEAIDLQELEDASEVSPFALQFKAMFKAMDGYVNQEKVCWTETEIKEIVRQELEQ
jgi:hypothetical protein